MDLKSPVGQGYVGPAKRSRLLRLLTGLWTLMVTGFSVLATPSVYASVGVLSPQQVQGLHSAWVWASLVVAVGGVVGLDRETRAGRWACIVALLMVAAQTFALPLISLDFDPAQAYPVLRLALIAAPNLLAVLLLSLVVRP